MPQVDLTKIIIDEKRQDQIIVLREKGGDRQFPIVIGFLEATSIKLRLAGKTVPRPMTHDLVVNLIMEFGARIDRVVVDALVGNTFYAKLVLRTAADQELRVDCRPSDAIAIAVRAAAPIFVEEEVFKKATIFKIE